MSLLHGTASPTHQIADTEWPSLEPPLSSFKVNWVFNGSATKGSVSASAQVTTLRELGGRIPDKDEVRGQVHVGPQVSDVTRDVGRGCMTASP